MSPDSSDKKERQPPTWPGSLSVPAWRFVEEQDRLLRFVAYIGDLAMARDQTAKIAVKALYETSEPERFRSAFERIDKHGATQVLRKFHRPMLVEMMTCRLADNFLTYVSELMALIFKTRPETLRSSETVRLDMVLKHDTMDQLIADLVDHRVNQLSYQGMRDLAAYLSDRLGFDLYPRAADMLLAVRIVESRNVIVHNRGIVNAIFLSRVPGSSSTVGSPLPLSAEGVFDDIDFLSATVADIDKRAAKKFVLPAVARNAAGASSG